MNIEERKLELKEHGTINNQDDVKLNTNESISQIEHRQAREFIGEWIYSRHGSIGAGEI